MKNVYLKGLITMTMALTLMACGSNSNNKNPANRTDGNNNRGGQAAPSGVQSLTGYWNTVNLNAGSITVGNAPGLQPNVNDISRYFLSTDWNWNIIGATTTAADTNFNTSIFPTYYPAGTVGPACQNGNCLVVMNVGIGNNNSTAPLTFQNNQTLATVVQSGQQVALNNSGAINLAFFDSYTGTQPNGSITPAIPVSVGIASGSFVQGTNVNLVFNDGEGTINVVGTLSGQSMNAQIRFANTTTVNTLSGTGAGISPAAGVLGTVQVQNVCTMFRCQ